MSIADATRTEELKLIRPTIDLAGLNMLIYGEPGAGKTFLIGQADRHPKLGPTFYMDCDGGMLTLAANPPQTWYLRDPEATAAEADTPAMKLSRFEKAYHYLSRGNHGFKSVALDTLGGLIRVHHDYLAASMVAKGKRESIHETTLPDYNLTKNYITFWLSRFRDLPMHFFVTCHAEMKTRSDGVDIIRPLVFEKLAKPIEAMFDIVGYLSVGEYVPKGGDKPQKCRKLIVDFDATDMLQIHAKGRLLGDLGGTIINPTMSILYNRIVKSAAPATTQTLKQTPNTGD